LLVSVKCRLLGVVLNAVNSRAPDYYYSYRYYPYSYGYGPQESSGGAHEGDEAEASFKSSSGRHNRGDQDDIQEL
jgi:hypothetical protein